MKIIRNTDKKERKSFIFSKFIWFVNLALFVSVVFLGIEQAGRGAEIAKLEDGFEEATSVKRDLTEKIFTLSSEGKIENNASDLGFSKPNQIYYFNSDDVFAKLPVR